MIRYLLDASALLVFIQSEAGFEQVSRLLEGGECGISAVNYSEVLFKLDSHGVDRASTARQIESLPLEVLPVSIEEARKAAWIPKSKKLGLSLGDRFCLAAAKLHHVPAVTTDRQWSHLKADGFEIISLR
jgi:ribonuclease VapC